MLNLERVRQTDESRRTQAERAAFGVCRKRDAVALRVSISQSWRRVLANRAERLTLFLRQLRAARALHPLGERLNQRREIVIKNRGEIRVAVLRQGAEESRRTNQRIARVAVLN